jgi:hypothetical protein
MPAYINDRGGPNRRLRGLIADRLAIGRERAPCAARQQFNI